MNTPSLMKMANSLAVIALAAGLAACDNAKVDINGDGGKPLSQIDLSGPPPHALALLGPDNVTITPGDKLAITVDGDPDSAAKLRFTLKEGTLGILRQSHIWSARDAVAVHVIMPAPRELVMSGSGSIDSKTMADKASVTIAGSGRITTSALAVARLAVTIAGTGAYSAGGQAKALELNIAGSGNADMGGLKTDKAEVNIAGTGNSRFASDGNVTATILGSGAVTVTGHAHCTVSAIGSGRLVCVPGDGKGIGAASAASGNAPDTDDSDDDDTPDSKGKDT